MLETGTRAYVPLVYVGVTPVAFKSMFLSVNVI